MVKAKSSIFAWLLLLNSCLSQLSTNGILEFQLKKREQPLMQGRFLQAKKISANSHYSRESKIVEKDLLNYYNAQYYGTLYVGS